jgi:hypothetical protein
MVYTQPPSRSNSLWSVAQSTKVNTPADARSEIAGQSEKDTQQYGRIIGGKYIEEQAENDTDASWGPLTKIDGVDIPLTLTEKVHENDKDYIVLTFATDDGVGLENTLLPRN